MPLVQGLALTSHFITTGNFCEFCLNRLKVQG